MKLHKLHLYLAADIHGEFGYVSYGWLRPQQVPTNVGRDHFVTPTVWYEIEKGARFLFLIISSTTFSSTHTSTPFSHFLATIVVKGAMPSFAWTVLDWLADGTKNKSAHGVSDHELLQEKHVLDREVKSVSGVI